MRQALETPLIKQPYFSPLQPRPGRFHQTKDFAFASAPAAARALRDAGVDVVGLANNHLYDARRDGVRQTLATLGRAGFGSGAGHFGAGLTEADAWRPAVVRIRGVSVAFVGCTTITETITYVADGARKGGAARCDQAELTRRVTALRSRHDIVIVMIHGGYEYERTPSRNIRRLSRAASRAGATLIVDHHPHVVGGFERRGASLTAWTLGNLLFDQNVWPTFQSYLLRVDMRDGRVVRAYTEPFMIEGYRPRAILGELADHVAREAAGREQGPFVIEDGAMEVDLRGAARRRRERVRLRGRGRSGTVFRLPSGTSLERFAGPATARLGRDLLWAGSFEDEDVGVGNGSAGLWAPGARRFDPRAAYRGAVGVRLSRRAVDTSEVVATPRHRVLVDPGARLSLVGMLRTSANARPRATLNLYGDTQGRSSGRRRVRLGRGRDRRWRAFRLDLTIPRDVVAVAPLIRLGPPASRTGAATADVDDVALIAWAGTRARRGPLYDRLLVTGRGTATLRRDTLPAVGPSARLGAVTALPPAG